MGVPWADTLSGLCSGQPQVGVPWRADPLSGVEWVSLARIEWVSLGRSGHQVGVPCADISLASEGLRARLFNRARVCVANALQLATRDSSRPLRKLDSSMRMRLTKRATQVELNAVPRLLATPEMSPATALPGKAERLAYAAYGTEEADRGNRPEDVLGGRQPRIEHLEVKFADVLRRLAGFAEVLVHTELAERLADAADQQRVGHCRVGRVEIAADVLKGGVAELVDLAELEEVHTEEILLAAQQPIARDEEPQAPKPQHDAGLLLPILNDDRERPARNGAGFRGDAENLFGGGVDERGVRQVHRREANEQAHGVKDDGRRPGQ